MRNTPAVFTCTHAAQHGSVADTWGVSVVGGGVVGCQARQEEAPRQDNRGQINDCYPGKQLQQNKTCYQLTWVVIVQQIYCRFAELLLQSGSIPEINY